jgi:predicted lipoprotein with Yx(FWY)xxD motif
MNKRSLLALAPVAAALVIAGCGGGGGGGGSSAYGAAPAPQKQSASAPASAPATSVDLGHSKLGSFLVDAKGRTLYLFEADKSTSSTCYGACASLWPPLTTSGTVKAGTSVMASALGTTHRKDGATEVTYHGHPLYYYAGDSKPGQTTGQDLNQFGAKWYVVSRAGSKVDHDGH